MAVIRYGSVVADARGSIEGVVYSKNRGGNYIRNRTVGVNPQSPAQELSRQAFSAAAAAWADLLEEGKESWKFAAEQVPAAAARNLVGESIVLTGQQFFQRINASVLFHGGSIIKKPPIDGVESRIADYSVAFMGKGSVSAEFEIELTVNLSGPLAAQDVIDYWATTPRGPGSFSARADEMRYFASSVPASPPLDAEALGAAYVARFGAVNDKGDTIPTVGSKIAFGLRTRNVAGPEAVAGTFSPLIVSRYYEVQPPA